MDTRYMTMRQIEPFVKDMMFFVDFMEKYGDRVDLTVDIAVSWANDILWEKAACSMFGEERKRMFLDYQAAAKVKLDAEKDSLETAYLNDKTKAADDYDTATANIRTDIDAKKAILESALENSEKDDAAISETIGKWLDENKSVIDNFHTAVTPYKGIRDDVMRAAKARRTHTIKAAEEAYNRSIAAEFARLYING